MKAVPGVRYAAELSSCGVWRWTLERHWPEEAGYEGIFAAIGLNPSTADALIDDRTVRKLMGFARRERCASYVMLNAFAFRATDPKDLKVAAKTNGVDWAIGAENDAAILRWVKKARFVLAAWGRHAQLGDRHRKLAAMLQDNGVPLLCFSSNLDGTPIHPLYQRDDAPLVPWKLAA